MSEMTQGALPQAHVYWDKRWSSEFGRREWLTPEPDIARMVGTLRQRGACQVLDLGCGVGRHALFLAQAGFRVTAVDMSVNGLEHLRAEAERLGLTLDLRTGPMTDLQRARRYLPGSEESESPAAAIDIACMDYVLAWNVIYHGDLLALGASLAEIARVLRAGGLFQGTLLSKRNVNFGLGREIAPDAWINEDVDDKAHPHCYRSAAEAAAMLYTAGLTPLELRDVEHEKPGSYHWHIVAERQEASDIYLKESGR